MDSSAYIGRTLADRYRISRATGEDAFGLRFVARDRQTRRQASVLLLRPDLVRGQEERLEAEAALLSGLAHPNAVRLLHQELSAEHAVRITEWDPGHTLGGVLDDIPLMSSSVRWGLEVAGALRVAHDQGILHRGVAPHTIRLVRRTDPPDRARLTDWGLSRLLLEGSTPLTASGQRHLGGVAWLPPELIASAQFDERSDLYALGAVLFHCLTGHPPYSGPELKVLAAHIHAPVPAPSQHISGVPHWLDQLVIGLLAKDPDDRPQTASAVEQVLHEGAAQLLDGAAHPDRVTANVAPTRLPNVALRGTAAQAPPRLDRVERATPIPVTLPEDPVIRWGLLVGAALGVAMVVFLVLVVLL